MQIRFLTSVAGARFAYRKNQIVDLSEETAREFLRARQAVVVEELAVAAAPETAAARTNRRVNGHRR